MKKTINWFMIPFLLFVFLINVKTAFAETEKEMEVGITEHLD